jgi:hypothetical protein
VTDIKKLTSLRLEAEAAVAALEHLPLGAPHAVVEERAREAVMDVRSPALERLFPEMPTQRAGLSDVISAFEFYEQQFTPSNYWQHVADLHRKTIDAYPELAAFIRSGLVSERVLFIANRQAVTVGRRPAEFADEIHNRLRRVIAQQLRGVEAHEPYASIIGEAAAWKSRIDAAVAQRRTHAADEFDRIDQQRREGAAASTLAEQVERDRLAAFFEARPNRMFSVGARDFSGRAIAALLRGEVGRDSEGHTPERSMVDPTLSDFDLAMRLAQAAEAVP